MQIAVAQRVAAVELAHAGEHRGLWRAGSGPRLMRRTRCSRCGGRRTGVKAWKPAWISASWRGQRPEPVGLLRELRKHGRTFQPFEHHARALVDAHHLEHARCRRPQSTGRLGALGFALGRIDGCALPVELDDAVVRQRVEFGCPARRQTGAKAVQLQHGGHMIGGANDTRERRRAHLSRQLVLQHPWLKLGGRVPISGPGWRCVRAQSARAGRDARYNRPHR